MVFSDGSPHARLVFVGDFPDETEDIIGLPFTSDRGILLDKIIKAMQMQRESIYLCNAVKCHPSGGAVPTQSQMDACYGFLEAQLKLVDPEVVVVMGEAVARQTLQTDKPLKEIHGQTMEVAGRKVIPVHDLNSMMKDPALKKPVWQALQEVMKLLEATP
jgi:DNA polymerase